MLVLWEGGLGSKIKITIFQLEVCAFYLQLDNNNWIYQVNFPYYSYFCSHEIGRRPDTHDGED